MPETPTNPEQQLDETNSVIVASLQEHLRRITDNLSFEIEPAPIYFPTLPFSARDLSA